MTKENSNLALAEQNRQDIEKLVKKQLTPTIINSIKTFEDIIPKYNNIFQREMELMRKPMQDIINSIEKTKLPIMQRTLESVQLTKQMQQLITQTVPTFDYIKSLNIMNNTTLKSLQSIQKLEMNYLKGINFNPLYNNISNLVVSYGKTLNNSFFKSIITKPIIEEYVSIHDKLISKLVDVNLEKLEGLSTFFTNYTKGLLDFKLDVVEEFIDIDMIEYRALLEYKEEVEINPYSKVSQVISPAYRNDINIEPTEVYKKSFFLEIQTKAKSIVKSVIDINKLSRLDGEPLIKPTVDAMEICVNLSDIIVDNENDFKKLIDWLYKLFWDNNQPIRNHTTNMEFNFINDLRRYFYHDLEHGDEKDIKKKMAKVKEFFETACGKKYPTCNEEWKKAQDHVYNLLEKILLKIKDSIN